MIIALSSLQGRNGPHMGWEIKPPCSSLPLLHFTFGTWINCAERKLRNLLSMGSSFAASSWENIKIIKNCWKPSFSNTLGYLLSIWFSGIFTTTLDIFPKPKIIIWKRSNLIKLGIRATNAWHCLIWWVWKITRWLCTGQKKDGKGTHKIIYVFCFFL